MSGCADEHAAPLRPARRRGALAADLGGRGPLQRRPRPGAHAVRRRAPAAQRDRARCTSGHALQLAIGDTIDPLEADAGLQRALPARATTTPASRRRTSSRRRCSPRGPRARSSAASAFEERVWEWLHEYGGKILDAVPPHRRVARLPAHALHDGRRLRPRGDAVLRAPLPPRLDLPREPDHQLVPVPRDVALRPRARARGRRRHALARSATRSPTATATSRSRRSGPRRSRPTSPSPCIPTTSATSTWSAAR